MRIYCGMVGAGLAMLLGAACMGAAPASPADRTPFKLIIGPETTRVNGPLLPDGTIDYGAALWEIWSKGVTESNNANPLFEKLRDEWSGYPAIDLSGDAEDVWDKHLAESTSHPWKPEELPDIAAWLKANEKGVALAVDASTCTHFCPAKPAAGVLPILKLSGVRGAEQALLARAMQRAASGDQVGARADGLAVHRLSLLITRMIRIPLVFWKRGRSKAWRGRRSLGRSGPRTVQTPPNGWASGWR